MPREFNGGLKALLAALKKGDETAVGSLRAVSGQGLVVGASDLHQSGLHNRAVRLDQLLGASRTLAAELSPEHHPEPPAPVRPEFSLQRQPGL